MKGSLLCQNSAEASRGGGRRKRAWKERRLHFSEFCLQDSIEELVDQVLNIRTFQIKCREITAEIMNPLVSLIS